MIKMINPKLIEENLSFVYEQLAKRNKDFSILNRAQELSGLRKKSLTEVEKLKAQRNYESKLIGELIKQKQSVLAAEKRKIVSDLKVKIDELDQKVIDLESQLTSILSTIPNLPDASVPKGIDENDNVEVRKWGNPIHLENPREHFELGVELGIIDFEHAVAMSGARFVSYRGIGARLVRALMNLMLDNHHEMGYEELSVPILVSPEIMYGTGQLPKFKDDAYYIERDNLYLIPTAEVPLTNFFKNNIFSEQELPKKLTAYTPCFRQESGSAGKDTKGIIRMHQFNKVEMVNLVTPDKSTNALEIMTNNAELILQKLGLPYRVITLCGGDLGFSASKTYDIELWLAGQNRYREVSSCSNCKDFQARRINLKYRNHAGELNYIHTLNGSGLAIDRVVAAILENYQQPDGSVKIPDALVKYLNGTTVISK